VALTDAQGAFTLEIGPGDAALVMEKSGLERDIVPLRELGSPVVLRPAPAWRREKVLVARLEFPDERTTVSDAALRTLLFSREPGVASVANYFYEISKGSLDLEEGALLHVPDPQAAPRSDDQGPAMILRTLEKVHAMDLAPFDAVDNRTGALRPDGKPDNLWVVPSGTPGVVTQDDRGLRAVCHLAPLPWNRREAWPVVFFPDETPLGFIVHENLHAQGENRVDDFYLDSAHPLTAGAWDVMDAGMFRGWDRYHPDTGPWQEDMAYSPSQPMGWVRTDLWYYGAFRDTVPTLKVARAWEGWIDPLERAPRDNPQRVLVPDPRHRGRFWEFDVRRPFGFDRGRVGDRWGPGYEGLVVARVDPSLLTRGEPRGPVRVLDAHPGTPEPARPRYPGGRWQLDDAAFNVGPGENPAGKDGPLSWRVLEADPSGRLKVRIALR
jgi:hypothetical protein